MCFALSSKSFGDEEILWMLASNASTDSSISRWRGDDPSKDARYVFMVGGARGRVYVREGELSGLVGWPKEDCNEDVSAPIFYFQ